MNTTVTGRHSGFAWLLASALVWFGGSSALVAQPSSPPVISVIPDQAVYPNSTSRPIAFVIGDVETPASQLTLAAASSDTNLIPVANIIFDGTGSNRSLTITPSSGSRGTATVSVTVSDSDAETNSTSFLVRVEEFTAGTNGTAYWTGWQATWGDCDNDGDLDCLMTFGDWADTRVYRNDGHGLFTEGYVSPLNGFPGAAQWADYDNDGYLDFASASYYSGHYSPNIYRNRGDGTFTLAANPLPTPYGNGFLHWADYDNDGDPDLLFQEGRSSPRLIRNDGQGRFTDMGTPFGSSFVGSIGTWGDFNDDGALDVIIGGTIGYTNVTKLFLGDGNGAFSDSGQVFQGFSGGSIECADLDNDGDLDVIMSGSINFGIAYPVSTQVYRNDGGRFTAVATAMPGLISSLIAIGDYNNDGRPDILLRGIAPDNNPFGYAGLWVNQGNLTFTDAGLTLATNESALAAWADVDNDGALDFVTTRYIDSALRLLVYHNNYPIPNVAPTAPTSLNAVVTSNSVEMFWGAASDSNQAGGLTYNVRVGSAPNETDVLAPLANPTNGLRQVAAPGNTQHRRSLKLKNLLAGNYFWSVQAVDYSYAGSPFAGEEMFVINGPPTLSHITNLTTLANTATPPIPFTVRGVETASNKLTLTATSSNPALVPTNNILFAGTNRNRTVMLTPAPHRAGAVTITLRLTDANGESVTDSFVLTVVGFTELASGLPVSSSGASAWADYDGDGDLDLAVNAAIYRNDGGTFTNASPTLPLLTANHFVWVDYDSDGDLDLTESGWGTNGASPKLYLFRNDGGDSFTAIIPPGHSRWR